MQPITECNSIGMSDSYKLQGNVLWAALRYRTADHASKFDANEARSCLRLHSSITESPVVVCNICQKDLCSIRSIASAGSPANSKIDGPTPQIGERLQHMCRLWCKFQADTVITTFPLGWPVSRYSCAAAASSNGKVLAMTAFNFPVLSSLATSCIMRPSALTKPK